jgi:hypothetical protein
MVRLHFLVKGYTSRIRWFCGSDRRFPRLLKSLSNAPEVRARCSSHLRTSPTTGTPPASSMSKTSTSVSPVTSGQQLVQAQHQPMSAYTPRLTQNQNSVNTPLQESTSERIQDVASGQLQGYVAEQHRQTMSVAPSISIIAPETASNSKRSRDSGTDTDAEASGELSMPTECTKYD